MAANLEKQQRFIELRAEGLSFDEIAKKVNISKPTLIKWSKELKDKIEEVTQIIEEQFLAEQRIKNIARAQKISDELDKAYAALSSTNYEKMNKKDLINVIKILEDKLNLKTQVNKGDEGIKYSVEVVRSTIEPKDDLRNGGTGRKDKEVDEN
jgi:DNA-binding XRE family transcriptional regulator